MQVPREQVEYMYQLIEAQRDFFLGVKEQWKVKLNFIHVYMYACLHDYLPLVLRSDRRGTQSARS